MIVETTSELTIYEVEKLQHIFLKELNRKGTFILDMTLIEKIDIVGIQLLIALVNSAKKLHKKIEFINITQTALHQIKLCHCEDALGIVYE